MALFSNNIKITDFQLTSTEPKYSNRSWTGTQIQRSTGIQYYQLQFTMNFHQKDSAEYERFIATYGQGRAFSMDLGHLSKYTGSQTTAVSSTAVSAIGTYQVKTTNNGLEVGTLIQFQNHKKIYRVIANTGTVLSLFPNLRQQVGLNENIRYQNIEGQFVLDVDNNHQLNIKTSMNITLKATEDI
jgi:hypothetical protein